MTGPEHYSEAERTLNKAKEADSDSPAERYYLARAQVHATLATAPADDTHQPRRGDVVEAWLVGHLNGWDGIIYPEARDALDALLKEYRLRADAGTPLGEKLDVPPFA